MVQLPATLEQAQCLATLQNVRAPGLSPAACVSVNISSLSMHCQHPSPALTAYTVNCSSKQLIKPGCTRKKKKKKSTYLGQGQAHLPDNPSLRPTAVYTYLMCSRCRTKGSHSPAPAASTPAQAAGQHPAPSADSWQQAPGSTLSSSCQLWQPCWGSSL